MSEDIFKIIGDQRKRVDVPMDAPNKQRFKVAEGPHGACLAAILKIDTEREQLRAENERLRDLVQCLIDTDPDADAADGVTVLDVWRKDAHAVLASHAGGDRSRL